MVPARRPAPSGSVALLRFARDAARASRPCPTCRAFCTLPPRILGAIIQRGLWTVNLPLRSQGGAKDWYICAQSPRSETAVSAKKLVVSTYLQYILIAVGFFLLLVFVRQLSGVLLTFLMAAILAYILNPVVRRLERWRIPRVVAVVGVFLALFLAVTAALLILIIPAVGQVQSVVRDPAALVERATGLIARLRDI